MQTGNIQISPVNMENRQEVGIRVGDTVRVWQKVEEKGKTRLQAFEGIVLARKHGNEPGATFTVRRTNDPYGVEKIFPLYSPIIDKIEIIKRAKVRRSKLYHIREKAAREIKRQMRNLRFVSIATESDMQAAAEAEKAEQEKEQKSDDAAEETVEEKEETPAGEQQSSDSSETKEQIEEKSAE